MKVPGDFVSHICSAVPKGQQRLEQRCAWKGGKAGNEGNAFPIYAFAFLALTEKCLLLMFTNLIQTRQFGPQSAVTEKSQGGSSTPASIRASQPLCY